MAAHDPTLPVRTGFLGWLNKRLPVDAFVRDQLTGYFAPKNFNFWYFFGVLSLVALVVQLLSGIFLTMHYKVGELTAFDSVEYIMREVPYGWLIRYMHSTGASAFFIVVYLHMFRAFLYGSYKAPRELLWIFGMLVYLALMAEAFMGYVLPWGNMSFWGAQVIVNIFGVIPVIGPGLVEWIRGDYGIADSTLNRFFSLHVVAVPLVLILLIVLHLVALRQNGSNNPDGVEIKDYKGPDGKPLDGIPFHPYYTVKDLVGVGAFFLLFAVVVFFVPTFGGVFLEAPNFEPAQPLNTPGAHRAGVVLHALLRDPARRAGSAVRRAGHGAVARVPRGAAVARPLAGQEHALSRLDVEDGADAVRRRVRHARLPRSRRAVAVARHARADRDGGVFRLLRADALVYEVGSREAGAAPRDLRSWT